MIQRYETTTNTNKQTKQNKTKRNTHVVSVAFAILFISKNDKEVRDNDPAGK